MILAKAFSIISIDVAKLIRNALRQLSPKAPPGTVQTRASVSMRMAMSKPSVPAGNDGVMKKAPPGL